MLARRVCYDRSMNTSERLAAGFLAALDGNRPYAPPSAEVNLALAEAYAIQRAFNALRATRETVAGFKAAVNAPALQRALGLEAPVIGMLFATGARQAGATVARSGFRSLMIETELGFRSARRIEAPVADLPALRQAIASVAPVIELADPGFGRVAIRGTDLVATNAACGGFVMGAAVPLAGVDLDRIAIVLERDGERLHEACGADLLGDHWAALQWLVNSVIAQGYVIEPDHLLLTGALGPPQPALPGTWTASYSTLGALSIRVV